MKSKNYEEFIQKFEYKRTTDDCYTPIEVYNIIKDYVIDYYKLDPNIEIVRPFYPNGDYENFYYPKNCVVIDNPPFSILSKIKKIYCKNNIKFFLFAPSFTLFSSKDDKSICYIVANARIVYENNAEVNTSFVTNLDKYKIRVEPILKQKLQDFYENQKKIIKKQQVEYEYPICVISGALLTKYINKGIKINFKHKDLHFIQALKSQQKEKKRLFGSGYLISNNKAKELENSFKIKAKDLKIKKNDEKIKWELSEEEKEIIKNLG